MRSLTSFGMTLRVRLLRPYDGLAMTNKMARKVLISIIFIAGALGAFGVYLVKKLEVHINSPSFKSQIENQIADATGATVHIGSMDARLGFSPWISVSNVDLHWPADVLVMEAAYLRFDVEIMPLVRNKIVFSGIKISKPKMTLRAPRADLRPFLGGFSGQRNSRPRPFAIKSLTVDSAQLRIIENGQTSNPLLELDLDATVTKAVFLKVYTLFLEGTFTSKGQPGQLNANGRFGTTVDMQVGFKAFPLSLLGSNIVQLSFLDGQIDGVAKVTRNPGPLSWSVNANVTKPIWAKTGQEIPAEVSGIISSSGPITIHVVWASSSTNVSADLATADWRTRTYTMNLSGDRVNVEELIGVKEIVIQEIKSRRDPSVKVSTWSVTGDVRVRELGFLQHSLSDLTGSLIFYSDGGEFKNAKAQILGGTLSGSGSWTRDGASRPNLVSGNIEGRGFQIDRVLSATLSTAPWSGEFDVDLNVSRLPIPRGKIGGTALLRSISKSQSVTMSLVGAAAKDSQSPIKTLRGSLDFNPASRQFQMDLQAAWADGELATSATLTRDTSASAPVIFSGNGSLKKMDLTYFSGFAAEKGLSRGTMSADAHWVVKFDNSEVPLFLSPNGKWTAEVQLNDLAWRGVQMDNASLELQWNGDQLRFENVKGQISSGTFAGETVLFSRDDGQFRRFKGNGHISDVEISPLMHALFASPILQEGRFTGELELRGEMAPWDQQSLVGNFTIAGRKGRVRAESTMLELLTQINLQSVIQSVKGTRRTGIPFETLRATCTIEDGRYVMEQPFTMKNSSFELAYTGWATTDVRSAKGTMTINALVGTRNLLKAIPGVSNIVLGENGEFLPLVIDLTLEDRKLKTNFRSIQTLTRPAVDILKNVISLPAKMFERKEKAE